jgi:deoxyribodipyrimidine photolyase
MENFDIHNWQAKFLRESTLDPQEIEENRLRNLIGAAAMAAASLGSPNAQAQDVPNGTPQKTWQQMSAGEKGAKKAELVKKGGFERFKQYKDSISNDATSRLSADFGTNAAKREMTPV